LQKGRAIRLLLRTEYPTVFIFDAPLSSSRFNSNPFPCNGGRAVPQRGAGRRKTDRSEASWGQLAPPFSMFVLAAKTKFARMVT